MAEIETKFTPGPWYLTGSGHGLIVCGPTTTLTDISGVRCLDIIARTDWARGEEDDANAHLISAAPDLYAALTRMLENELDNYEDGGDAVALAKAALAKARGEG